MSIPPTIAEYPSQAALESTNVDQPLQPWPGCEPTKQRSRWESANPFLTIRTLMFTRLRILVIGKSGVGKSSLINYAFKVLSCIRDVLQEYYVNLVRTHSTSQFFVVAAQSSSRCISSDSDVEMDTTQSRPSTPEPLRNRGTTILIDSVVTEVSRRPTIEKNMAFSNFAALQQSQDPAVESDPDANRETDVN
ncbi:hypothetical protein DFH09DRAFT_1304386 [Mycena vulgaris]|nr:hypothetical protein DFH09DRAFT_1304386 [Mycena vulgaris]